MGAGAEIVAETVVAAAVAAVDEAATRNRKLDGRGSQTSRLRAVSFRAALDGCPGWPSKDELTFFAADQIDASQSSRVN